MGHSVAKASYGSTIFVIALGTSPVPERIIGASYGDAYLAGLGIGLFRDYHLLKTRWVRLARRIEPDPDRHALYESYYALYREAYVANQTLMHRLARLGA